MPRYAASDLVAHVCRCPIKRTLGLNGVKPQIYEKVSEHNQEIPQLHTADQPTAP